MIEKRILITGANSFVGQILCELAATRYTHVRGTSRSLIDLPAGVENVVVGNVDDTTEWQNALNGCDVVIHLAARVHVMREDTNNSVSEFHSVNTAGTEHLARCASDMGIKRLVYVSSIGVNGRSTTGDIKFSEFDKPNPHNAYAISKWSAEKALWNVASETGLEIVIVRPPLVYGRNAPGNFAQMMTIVARGIPLPLGLVSNKRSFIYVNNLVDALLVCSEHLAAANQTYLVSDNESISTPDLLRKLADAIGVSSRVFQFPPNLLKIIGKISGNSKKVELLLGSLQVDNNKIFRELNWIPPFTLQEGIEEAASRYFSREIDR
jgi:nucleoside-diphosphate-sugar epimerase